MITLKKLIPNKEKILQAVLEKKCEKVTATENKTIHKKDFTY